MPVYNTRPEYLKELVGSLQKQTYPHWELCLADGKSTLVETLQCLKEYEQMDSRIRVLRLSENLGISGNTNRALDFAEGEYIAFSDHDDFWEPDALYEVIRAVNEQDADLIYTDEDKVDEFSRIFYEPHLKPDYSPETLCSCNYFCHLMVVSRRIMEKAGRLDPAFDGSQDHEFALRVCDATDKIVHIPRVLYHWRQFSTSMSKQHLEKCQACGRQAVREHLKRIGLSGEVTQAHGYRMHLALAQKPLLSVIVLVHGSSEKALENSLRLKERSSYQNLEFILVVPSDASVSSENDGVQMVSAVDGAGDYQNRNRAASLARGKYLLFMSEDAVPLSDDWIEELLMLGQLEAVGAVGAKLFYADGEHIYATNYVVRAPRPVRQFQGHSRSVIGQGGLERILRNVSAVPVELLLTAKADFDDLSGFREDFQQGYGDVDYCLRLLELGRRNVFTPFSEARLVERSEGEPFYPASDLQLFHKLWGEQRMDSYYGRDYEQNVEEISVHA